MQRSATNAFPFGLLRRSRRLRYINSSIGELFEAFSACDVRQCLCFIFENALLDANSPKSTTPFKRVQRYFRVYDAVESALGVVDAYLATPPYTRRVGLSKQACANRPVR